MADFGDNIQTLMDEVYSEWQKEKNRAKEKWEVLNNFSEAHQIAVIFGNFNRQVENGGIHQWIYNGYFHDDSEKLTQYLELGKDLDERCKTILDIIYKLDQCAHDTECDRDGYYIDPDDEDSESHFIGDMIDCGKFDTWYYEHCGGDDWWGIINEIIENMAGRDLTPIQQEARTNESISETLKPMQHEDAETDIINPQSPFSVYIKNIHSGKYSDTAIPFPTDPVKLRTFLDNMGVIDWRDIKNVELSTNDESDFCRLSNMLNDMLYSTEITPHTLNELNFLAVKVEALVSKGEYGGIELFLANIEANRNCGSITEMLNLTFSENLNKFDVHPAFTPEDFGDFLMNNVYPDVHMDAIDRLAASAEDINLELVAYIEKLEQHVDLKKIGQTAAKEENGVFTEQGYLFGGNDGLLEIYRSPEDIPQEHIIMQDYPSELRFLTKHIPPNADRAELEYLAGKIKSMSAEQMKVFGAVVEAGLYCGSVSEIINTAENLDCFKLQPFTTEADYGDHRLEQDYNDAWAAYNRLDVSADTADRAIIKNIMLLNRSTDAEMYGHHAAKEEGGVFTKQGLLTVESEPKVVYRGIVDISDLRNEQSAERT